MIKTKAAVLIKKNKLKILDLYIPELQEGQVLIKIKYSSICHTQLQEIEGTRGKDKYIPHCLGHEATGIVIKVSKKVKKVKRGDKVCLTWIKSKGSICYNTKYTTLNKKIIINAGPVNTFSEYAVVSENKVIKLKKKSKLKDSVLLGCAIPTAFNCFLKTLSKSSKKNLLIIGAGGLGLSCLYIAKKLGFKNIFVLDKNKKKLLIAKKIGADNILLTNEKNFISKIKKFDNFFYNVVECTGSLKILNNSINCTKNFGGHYVVIGNYPDKSMLKTNVWNIISGRIVSGAWTNQNYFYEDNLNRILKLSKKFDSSIFFGKKTYKLEEINNALQDFKNGKVIRPLIKFE